MEQQGVKDQTLTISGMTCGHCVMSVKKELVKIDGVTVNAVKIGSASVSVDTSKVTDTTLQHAVEEAGYSVTSIQ
jgi:copper chaperone